MAYNSFIIKGNICQTKNPKELDLHERAYVVCVNGISKGVFEILPEEFKNLPIYDYGDALIFPGMIDMHVHAPQFAFRGTSMDLELMEWLNRYTFPEEEKYENLEYAEKAYGMFVNALKNSATTRACIFATRHRYATELLMNLMEESGLISFVGKVNMDRQFARLAGLLELADDEFVRARDHMLDYTEDIRKRIITDDADDVVINMISLNEYVLHNKNMQKLIKEIANISGAEVNSIDPESYVPQLAYLGIKKLGDIEVMVKENYELAIALANKALSMANLDIVSSSVALRFLCRAELLNKNYDFEKIVEFLKISLRSQEKAERQAKLLLKQKGDF